MHASVTLDVTLVSSIVLVGSQNRDECFLRDVDTSELLHLCLAFLLLLEKFLLSTYVAAVQLRRDVFTVRLDRCSSDDRATDRTLNWDLELVTRDRFGELFTVMKCSSP